MVVEVGDPVVPRAHITTTHLHFINSDNGQCLERNQSGTKVVA